MKQVLKPVQAFKREIAAQTTSEEVLRTIRLARLPHYVWIVEAHVRELCHSDPCVIGTVIYDATSSDHGPRMLALSTPGATAAFPPGDDSPVIVKASSRPWSSMLPVH